MMKNLIIILFLFGVLFISILSCEDNNAEQPILVSSDEICDCDNTVLYTIPELEPSTGFISIKIPLIPQDTIYTYKYWISYNFSPDSDCLSCFQSYIVCNDEFITGELKEVLSSGEEMEIVFAGRVQNLCVGIWTNSFHRYNSIVLTKIEVK